MYTKSVYNAKTQLELITCSANAGMEFSQKKCTYLIIGREKLLPQTQNLCTNGLSIPPIPHKVCYKYLDIDENVSDEGIVKKDRVF